MKKNNIIISSTCVPLPVENIDTDQIIPARFLKAITREGFGENLFRDWRFDAEDNLKKNFVLNNTKYKGEILIAGRNFGCGSSREHAAWALSDYGFKAVFSSFFADIFKNNALINHLLPVIVSEKFLQKLFRTIENDPKAKVAIDIEKQTIRIEKTGEEEKFPMDPYRKMCFLKGYDDVDYLLSLKSQVLTFEKARKNDYSIV
ncbi:MAG: 3-isopropylmalate dehydratase small subunit [Candidatus Levybacteria bacterium]|nr:3-isopropylmalate dehydratase small subunit [Candidatus Levybacteria bacterium]